MAKPKPTKMHAILGRCRRSGQLNLVPRSSALALFGSCFLDLRHATVDGELFKMKVTVLFGSATLILPEGAVVKPSGFSMLAGSLVDIPDLGDEADLPMLDVEWSLAFGKLRILDPVRFDAMQVDESEPPPPRAEDRISELVPSADQAPTVDDAPYIRSDTGCDLGSAGDLARPVVESGSEDIVGGDHERAIDDGDTPAVSLAADDDGAPAVEDDAPYIESALAPSVEEGHEPIESPAAHHDDDPTASHTDDQARDNDADADPNPASVEDDAPVLGVADPNDDAATDPIRSATTREGAVDAGSDEAAFAAGPELVGQPTSAVSVDLGDSPPVEPIGDGGERAGESKIVEDPEFDPPVGEDDPYRYGRRGDDVVEPPDTVSDLGEPSQLNRG